MVYKYTAFDDWYDTQSGLTGPEAELRSSFTAAREQKGTAVTLEELQAEINGSDHGRVSIPKGIHIMEPRSNGDAVLYVSSRKRLTLEGPGALQFPDGVGGIRVVAPNGIPAEDCTIQGLGIFGGENGIVVSACHRITIEKCVISGTGHNDGAGIKVVKQSHNVHMVDNRIVDRDIGLQLESPDLVARTNVIRACRVGIFWNSPTTHLTENHIFPDHAETDYGIEVGPWASHLATSNYSYIDNCRLAFIKQAAPGWINGKGPKFANTKIHNVRHEATAKVIDGEFHYMKDNDIRYGSDSE